MLKAIQPLPVRLNHNRVAMFIDNSNLFYSQKELETRINYLSLKNYFSAQEAYVYMSLNPENISEQRFLSFLERNKFHVCVEKMTTRQDGSRKANLDVEIALDMLSRASDYDVAILVSGDGDFHWLVQRLKHMGKYVVIVGLDGMTSPVLKKKANRYINLRDICKVISRKAS
jgi:uncharacterized LabA/DUF88 family protein